MNHFAEYMDNLLLYRASFMFVVLSSGVLNSGGAVARWPKVPKGGPNLRLLGRFDGSFPALYRGVRLWRLAAKRSEQQYGA